MLDMKELVELELFLKEDIKRMNLVLENEKIEKLNKLKNGTKFYLKLTYIEEKNIPSEMIPIEGYENGMALLETYRSMGFDLFLRSIELTLNWKKVKKINFKYKWD